MDCAGTIAEKVKADFLASHFEDVDLSCRECLNELRRFDLSVDMTQKSPMMKEITQGVEYANAIYKFENLYSKLSQTVIVKTLSYDEDEMMGMMAFYICHNLKLLKHQHQTPKDPNCIVLYDYERDPTTVWLVARGSSKPFDWLNNFSFLGQIGTLGNLQCPQLAIDHADSCVDRLKEFLKDLKETCIKEKRRMPKCIGFAGHSLGGAIATACYLKYNMSTEPEDVLDSFVINLSGPTIFYCKPGEEFPKYLQLNAKAPKIKLSDLRIRIHNIVQQHDLIPRLVGPHKFPEMWEDVLDRMLSSDTFVDLSCVRLYYTCMGHHYFLNPKHKSREEDVFLKIGGPHKPEPIQALLGCWPSELKHLPWLMNDHKHSVSLQALIRIMDKSDVKYEQLFKKAHLWREVSVRSLKAVKAVSFRAAPNASFNAACTLSASTKSESFISGKVNAFTSAKKVKTPSTFFGTMRRSMTSSAISSPSKISPCEDLSKERKKTL